MVSAGALPVCLLACSSLLATVPALLIFLQVAAASYRAFTVEARLTVSSCCELYLA